MNKRRNNLYLYRTRNPSIPWRNHRDGLIKFTYFPGPDQVFDGGSNLLCFVKLVGVKVLGKDASSRFYLRQQHCQGLPIQHVVVTEELEAIFVNSRLPMPYPYQRVKLAILYLAGEHALWKRCSQEIPHMPLMSLRWSPEPKLETSVMVLMA